MFPFFCPAADPTLRRLSAFAAGRSFFSRGGGRGRSAAGRPSGVDGAGTLGAGQPEEEVPGCWKLKFSGAITSLEPGRFYEARRGKSGVGRVEAVLGW
jgi:hypothetical protein